MFLGPLDIQLPWFISLHVVFLATLGFESLLLDKPEEAFAGVTLLGLAAGYLSCSYMPIEQNAFLYASVPVRIFLALAAASRVALDRARGVKTPSHAKLLKTMLYDGLGGAVLGWYLGRFDGVAPGLQ